MRGNINDSIKFSHFHQKVEKSSILSFWARKALANRRMGLKPLAPGTFSQCAKVDFHITIDFFLNMMIFMKKLFFTQKVVKVS